MAEKRLHVTVGANVSDFVQKMNMMTKNLDKISKETQKAFGPVAEKVGTALKYVGTAAMAGFGAATVASVKGAASLESYRNTLNVVMKDQKLAGETMAWAVDFANKTPFETKSVVEATVKLEAYGLKAKEVLPAIGDMAAVMNKDIIQAVEAVADAQTGELERLKEFGITKNMIIEQNNKIARDKQIVNNQGQIVDQEQFNKALLSLMNERFKGGMEIQATSFSGLMSTIKGVFSTTLATMAGISATGEVKIGGFFDTIKKKAQLVVDKLNDWQKSGHLEKWAGQAQKALTAFWGAGEKIFDGLIAAGKFIYNNWALIGPIIAGVLAGFMYFKAATAVVNALTIATKLLNGTMAMNPIGLVAMAIGVLITAGVALYQNWDKVRHYGLQAWATLKIGVLGAVKGMLAGMESFLGWIPVVGDKIRSAMSNLDAKIIDEQSIRNARAVAYAYREIADEADNYAMSSESVQAATASTTKSMEKLSEATKETRAEWEQMSDVLGIRLKQTQTLAESNALALGKDADSAFGLTQKVRSLNDQMGIQRQIIDRVNQGYQETAWAKGETSEETEKLRLKLYEEQKTLVSLEKQIKDTISTVREQADQMRSLGNEVDKVQRKYSQDMASALEEYQQKAEEVRAKEIEDEKKLTEALEGEIANRARALQDFVGLFDAVNKDQSVSGEDLLKNLDDQVDAFDDWQKNINKLVQRGVDQGLVAELRAMGPKAYREIAALNSLTDGQLAQYVMLWRQKSEMARREAEAQLEGQKQSTRQKIEELHTQTVGQLEALKNEWQKKSSEIRATAEEELKKIADSASKYGVDFVSNFADGIESRFGRLRDALRQQALIVEQQRQMVQIVSGGSIPTPSQSGYSNTNIGSDGLTDYTRAVRDALVSTGSSPISADFMAEGGIKTQPGWTVVGERGPELLSLPKGSSVAPLPEGMKLESLFKPAPQSGPGVVVHVAGSVITEGQLVDKVVNAVRRLNRNTLGGNVFSTT